MVERRKPVVAVALEMVQPLRDDACMGGLTWSDECWKGWRTVGPKSAEAKRYNWGLVAAGSRGWEPIGRRNGESWRTRFGSGIGRDDYYQNSSANYQLPRPRERRLLGGETPLGERTGKRQFRKGQTSGQSLIHTTVSVQILLSQPLDNFFAYYPIFVSHPPFLLFSVQFVAFGIGGWLPSP